MIGYYPNGVPARTLRERILRAFFGREPEVPTWAAMNLPHEKRR